MDLRDIVLTLETDMSNLFSNYIRTLKLWKIGAERRTESGKQLTKGRNGRYVGYYTRRSPTIPPEGLPFLRRRWHAFVRYPCGIQTLELVSSRSAFRHILPGGVFLNKPLSLWQPKWNEYKVSYLVYWYYPAIETHRYLHCTHTIFI